MVKDEEVTVEKYDSPEEKQKMEEATRLEEERRKAELVSISQSVHFIIGVPIIFTIFISKNNLFPSIG